MPPTRILLIHLGALGAVVRSTALLPAIHRKFPNTHITWVTDAPADILLREHPLVDRVMIANLDAALALGALEFDVAMVIDKSLKASGLLRATKARSVYGYLANTKTGAIEPATPAARASWELGISNHLKFNVNRKPETQLIHEALELNDFRRDPYSLVLSEGERVEVLRRRAIWSDGGRATIFGLNTGCANTIEYKKLTIDGHLSLLRNLYRLSEERERRSTFVLLGGREDTERNREIAARAKREGISTIESSTDRGLRDGMISVASSDVVISGDSLGLHLALGFQKPVVAWFGPTCSHEIDLFGGSAIQAAVSCAPCWKRSCSNLVMCHDQVDFAQMASAAFALAVPQAPDRLEIAREI